MSIATGLVLAGVFIATLVTLLAIWTVANRRRLDARAALLSRGEGGTADAPSIEMTILKPTRETIESKSLLAPLIEGRGFTTALRTTLDEAGVTFGAGEFLLLSVLIVAVGGVAGGYLLGPLGTVVGAMVIALVIPAVIVGRQQARIKKFEEQLPEALDVIVNALKAGYSLQAGMRFVGEELPQPLGPEFARFHDEQRLGVDIREALGNLQRRVTTADMGMLVTSMLVQRETGGNLAEILTGLASLIRERMALRGRIDTLTAEPKLSAVVLTLLPIALFLGIRVINPEYLSPLLETRPGHLMLAYSAASIVVGFLFMRKIAAIDL
jgi:tight adherence protein B